MKTSTIWSLIVILSLLLVGIIYLDVRADRPDPAACRVVCHLIGDDYHQIIDGKCWCVKEK